MEKDGKKSYFSLLIAIKYAMFPVALGVGIHALSDICARAPGFRFLGITLIVIGVALLILFIIDCKTYKKAFQIFMVESLCFAVPLYIATLALGIFALAVSSAGTGKSLPGVAYKEYQLSDYFKWMQNKVNDTHQWDKYYKRTLTQHQVCKDMFIKYNRDTLDMLHERSLTDFESNCCKPPEECNFNYTSPTVWTKTENNNTHYSNSDCNMWSNDPSNLCFNCQSCKAAFVHHVKRSWIDGCIFIVIVFAKQVIFTLLYAVYRCFSKKSGKTTTQATVKVDYE